MDRADGTVTTRPRGTVTGRPPQQREGGGSTQSVVIGLERAAYSIDCRCPHRPESGFASYRGPQKWGHRAGRPTRMFG